MLTIRHVGILEEAERALKARTELGYNSVVMGHNSDSVNATTSIHY